MVRRYCVGTIGIFIMAYGVAFSIIADLGTSPISSLPYVSSLTSPLTVGTATIIMNAGFVLIQIAIKRKHYDLAQLVQIPCFIIFGFLIDFALWTLQLSYSTYVMQWVYCVLGILLVGVGVAVTVMSRVIVMGGEGLVVALTWWLQRRYGEHRWTQFGNIKIAFDVTLVLSAIILSLSTLGYVAGVREGTIAAAVFVGVVAKSCIRRCSPVFERFFSI